MLLSVQCMNLIENGIILGMWDINRIYRYRFDDDKVTSLYNAQSVDRCKFPPYGQVCEYKKYNFLFAPLGENRILLYNSLNHELRTIELKKSVHYENKINDNLFCEIVPLSDYLLLIPMGYDAIVRFHRETEEIEYFYECIENIIRDTAGLNDKLFFRGYAIHNGAVYLASYSCEGRILKINHKDMTYESLLLDWNTISICGGEDVCWLLTKEGKLLEWDIEKNKIEILINNDYETTDIHYQELVESKKWIVMLPWKSNQIIIYDKGTKVERIMSIDSGTYLMSMTGQIVESSLYVFFHELRKLYIINLESMLVEKTVEIQSPIDDEIEYWEGIYGYEKGVFEEIDNKSLKQFISDIVGG